MAHPRDPRVYARHAPFVPDLGMPLLNLLAARSGERTLDLRCGDGALTAKVRESGCQVVGVDSDLTMVTEAGSRGPRAHVMDAQALSFVDEFNAVFSNAALPWMKRADDVLAGAWKALKLGGRFVGEFDGKGNVATVVRGLRAALVQRQCPIHLQNGTGEWIVDYVRLPFVARNVSKKPETGERRG